MFKMCCQSLFDSKVKLFSTFFIMSTFYAQLYDVNTVNDWLGDLGTYLKIKDFG